MCRPYRTMDDVLRSPWGQIRGPEKQVAPSDRVTRSTKLEDSVYADLRSDDPGNMGRTAANMQIILAVQRETERKLRVSLEEKLVYQLGRICSLYPTCPRSLDELSKIVHAHLPCIVIVQLGYVPPVGTITVETCHKLQNGHPDIYFLLIGEEDSDCRLALHQHLRLIDYYDRFEPRLIECMTTSVVSTLQNVVPLMHGIFVRRQDEYVWVRLSDISCIEKIKGKHYCSVKGVNATYQIRGNIKEIKMQLGPSFWLCHASTLVNLDHIQVIDPHDHTILLKGDHLCTYSKAHGGEANAIIRARNLNMPSD